MSRKNGKITAMLESKVNHIPVRNSFVIAVIPTTVNYKKKSIDSTKGIIVDSSVKAETIMYDFKKGIILPENINVEEIMIQRKMLFIIPNDRIIRIGTKGSKTAIVTKKKTPIIFLRIATDFWVNPRVADGVLLAQNIQYSSNDSGNDGKELELSA